LYFTKNIALPTYFSVLTHKILCRSHLDE